MRKIKLLTLTLLTLILISLFASPTMAAMSFKTGYKEYTNFVTVGDDGALGGPGGEILSRVAQMSDWTFNMELYTEADYVNKIQQGFSNVGAFLPDYGEGKNPAKIYYTDTPIGYERGVFYVPASSDLHYQDYGSFNGMTVGTIAGNYQTDLFKAYASEKGFSVSFKEYADVNELTNALDSGAVSGIIYGAPGELTNYLIVDRFSELPLYIITSEWGKEYVDRINQDLAKLVAEDANFATTYADKYYATAKAPQAKTIEEEQQEQAAAEADAQKKAEEEAAAKKAAEEAAAAEAAAQQASEPNKFNEIVDKVLSKVPEQYRQYVFIGAGALVALIVLIIIIVSGKKKNKMGDMDGITDREIDNAVAEALKEAEAEAFEEAKAEEDERQAEVHETVFGNAQKIEKQPDPVIEARPETHFIPEPVAEAAPEPVKVQEVVPEPVAEVIPEPEPEPAPEDDYVIPDEPKAPVKETEDQDKIIARFREQLSKTEGYKKVAPVNPPVEPVAEVIPEPEPEPMPEPEPEPEVSPVTEKFEPREEPEEIKQVRPELTQEELEELLEDDEEILRPEEKIAPVKGISPNPERTVDMKDEPFVLTHESSIDLKKFGLKVFLQPGYGVDSDKQIGASATALYQHHIRGMIYPEKLMKTLVHNGQGHLYDRFIFQNICENKATKYINRDKFRILVPVSAATIAKADFDEWYMDMARKYNADVSVIRLDLAIDGNNMTRAKLAAITRLRRFGFGVALSQVGSPNYPLDMISQILPDAVVIDDSLLQPDEMDLESTSRLADMKAFCMRNAIPMEANRIDTRELFKQAIDAGCSVLRGNFLSRPVPLDNK